MKIKKSSVAIYTLALMLVTAGYWNYISQESKTIETMNVSQSEQKENDEENLGDATLVSNNELIDENNEKEEEEQQQNQDTEKKDEYFEESRLARDTMYSQTMETYQGMLNNSNVSEEQKAVVTQEITKLNKEKNAIMICENLINTKGFENCVIFVNVDSISVIVKAEELKTEEIAQIQNILSREMNAKVENIHIMVK
ncbi:MAG: SpoIIIAH-like family protein [Clostridia bacterium]|nr:SpoIIIAH-like family protein [Clostridia bacterium]